MTYKTDVEAPALIFEPRNTTLEMTDGETKILVITVENKGIISAFNVKLPPTNADEAMVLTLPYTEIKELKAGEKVSIPVKTHLIHASCHEAEARASYDYTCAAGRTVTTNMEAFAVQGGYCPLSGGGGGTAGGGGSGGTEVGGGGGSGGGGGGSSLEIPPGTGSNCGTDPTTPLSPNPDIGKICTSDKQCGDNGCMACRAGKCQASPDGVLCGYSQPINICRKTVCNAGWCRITDKTKAERIAVNTSAALFADPAEYVTHCPRVNNDWNKTNGCSLEYEVLYALQFIGFTDNTENPNKPLTTGPDFTGDCNEHDKCYRWTSPLLPNTKEGCDLRLLGDMRRSCDVYFHDRNGNSELQGHFARCNRYAAIVYCNAPL